MGDNGKREAKAGAGTAKTNGNGKDSQEKQGGLKGDERGGGGEESNNSINPRVPLLFNSLTRRAMKG
jgi:hypothetical protein